MTKIHISGPPIEVIQSEWLAVKKLATEKPGDEFLAGYLVIMTRAVELFFQNRVCAIMI